MLIKKRKHRKPNNLTASGPDAAVIELMSKYRSDLSKARQVYFYLYFQNETDALKVKSELLLNEFEVDLERSSDKSQWLCLASKEMKPNNRELIKLRQYFTKLTEKYNGNYDGWETEM